jgi:N-methylhydantoinase A
VPVFAESSLMPGVTITGPCIIDVGDTTIYVPENATCLRDRFYNFALSI